MKVQWSPFKVVEMALAVAFMMVAVAIWAFSQIGEVDESQLIKKGETAHEESI